jgi:hypothetical protein
VELVGTRNLEESNPLVRRQKMYSVLYFGTVEHGQSVQAVRSSSKIKSLMCEDTVLKFESSWGCNIIKVFLSPMDSSDSPRWKLQPGTLSTNLPLQAWDPDWCKFMILLFTIVDKSGFSSYQRKNGIGLKKMISSNQ